MSALLTGLGAIAFAAAGAGPVAAPQREASCILDTLPSSIRQTLVEVIAQADQARSSAALQENAGPIRDAALSCVQQFEWSEDERRTALQAFLYGLRFEASAIRLRANGLTEEQASQMFESLPSTMHEAVFGMRPMTPEETDVLQAAFEEVVDRLAGPDGNALSEYITARAGYAHYARELSSR